MLLHTGTFVYSFWYTKLYGNNFLDKKKRWPIFSHFYKRFKIVTKARTGSMIAGFIPANIQQGVGVLLGSLTHYFLLSSCTYYPGSSNLLLAGSDLDVSRRLCLHQLKLIITRIYIQRICKNRYKIKENRC